LHDDDFDRTRRVVDVGVHLTRRIGSQLTITVNSGKITGVMNAVEEPKYPANAKADVFSYSAKALTLPDGAVVSL
jgi:hypothetical protein